GDRDVRRIDQHTATAAVGHERTQLTGYFHVVLANDGDAAVAAYCRRGVHQTVGVDRRLEYLRARLDRRTRFHCRAGSEEIDRSGTVDLPLDADVAGAGIVAARYQINDGRVGSSVGSAGKGRGQLTHLGCVRR